MASAVPMETVVEFIKRINAGNVDKLCELMTEDHVFQDALGKRFIGRETLRGGWKMYYEMVSDYKVRGEQFFVDKNHRGGVWYGERHEQARRQIFQRRLLGDTGGLESYRA